MSTLTMEQAKRQADEILDFLMDKLQAASEKGPEHVEQFIEATAFTFGSCISIAAGKSSNIGPILGETIETLTEGIQAGMQAVGIDGTFIKIKRDRP